MARRLIIFSTALSLALSVYFKNGDDAAGNAWAAPAGGTISGRIVFAGDPPPARKLKVTKDVDKCGPEVPAQELVVGADKGIQYAVISVAGLKGTPPKTAAAATIDQKGCIFRPRVVVVGVGAPLDILNSDGVLHNFHTHGSKNPAMNRAQPGFRKKMSETFKHAETIKVTCDAHPWMAAWVVVADHPFIAVSDEGGKFTIGDVPPGNHTVEIWHESLGKSSQTVAVKAGEETKVTFELGRK